MKSYTTNEILQIIDEVVREKQKLRTNPYVSAESLGAVIGFAEELIGYFETDGEPQ